MSVQAASKPTDLDRVSFHKLLKSTPTIAICFDDMFSHFGYRLIGRRQVEVSVLYTLRFAMATDHQDKPP